MNVSSMGPCETFDGADFVFESSYTTFILGTVQLLALLGLVGWQQLHKYRARHGNFASADMMVSPSYIWILMAYGIASAFLGVLNIMLEVKKFPVGKVPVWQGISMGLAWGVYHMVLDGLSVFLCMKGTGWSSLKKTMWISVAIGLVMGTAQAVMNNFDSWSPGSDISYAYLLKLITEVLLLIWYLLLIILPHKIFHRRPAAVFYAGFWTIYRPIYILLLIGIYNDWDPAYCSYTAFTLLVYGLLIPAIVIMTLRKDSSYWQGIMTKSMVEYGTMKKTPSEADIRTPLLGTSIEVNTAQILADEMDGLDATIPTISFAHLKLSNTNTTTALLGAGGTARVFKGKYQNDPVAIKMLYCMELTPETVQNFFSESRLLCRLRHPNIVHVAGICVLPPSICMVMELCKGSLYELLRLETTKAKLDWEARLSMAIECACGVQCLHEQSPPLLHMDLKSPNFLVGDRQVQKWTVKDVLSWLSTVQVKSFSGVFRHNRIDGSTLLRHDRQSLALLIGAEAIKRSPDVFERLVSAVDDLGNVNKVGFDGVIKITDLELSQDLEKGKEDNNDIDLAHEIEVPQTVNWTAPEVIRHGKVEFSTAADVYSLAMVLWELLTGMIPFDEPGIIPSMVSKLVVEEKRRPPIPVDTPQEYAKLLERGWAENPGDRPSARAIKEELVLMMRRYSANRTLQRKKFLNSESSVGSVSGQTFEEGRFLAAESKESLATASGFSMGSLSKIPQESDPEFFSNLNREKKHKRTHSDGTGIKTSKSAPSEESCVDDIDQVYS